MDKKKLKATSSSASAGNMKELLASSKGAPIPSLPKEHMVQNVRLIWLDCNIDETNDDDCRDTIEQLRRVVNSIKTLTDSEECMKFLSENKDEKVCMIVSGSLGREIVSRVHNMPQVDSIFIFCGTKSLHEKWASKHSKMRGIFTQISPMCDTLKTVARHCEQNSIPISFASISDISNKTATLLGSPFKKTLILKDILITVKFEPCYLNEFIDFCHKEISKDYFSANIQKFTQEYSDKTSIWWYTHESFLYAILNRAVRENDMDIIIRMGFFVGDLHRQIKQLHNEQFGDKYHGKSFDVYHGQGLSKTDFNEMKKTKDGWMSFNNFLSTSRNRDVSMDFVHRTLTTPDLIGVLFVIKVDPSIPSTPFASITGLSYDENRDDEVLFSMHAVFRIGDIKKLNETKDLWQVDLTMVSDDDANPRDPTDRTRKGNPSDLDAWYRFSELLLDEDHLDEARQVCEILLKQTQYDREAARLNHQIGWIYAIQKNNEGAIEFYEKALELNIIILPPNHPLLATSYNSIGSVYREMTQYSKALASFKEAIEIYRNIPLPDHPDLVAFHNNIGLVYDKMEKHEDALSSFKLAVDIGKQSLPPDHFYFQELEKNIKEVKKKMKEVKKKS